jgi:signal transduction histidine kinase
MNNFLQTLVRNYHEFFRRGRIRPAFVYSFSLLTTLFIFLGAVFLAYRTAINPYLVLIIPVLINTWYGGLKPGLLSLLIIVFSLFLLFLIPGYQKFLPVNQGFFIDSVVYIIIGVFVSFIIDVSGKHDKTIGYEKKIQDYITRLALSRKNYNKALDEIKARDEFLAVASHELKTPVTSMLLQVQLALHNIRNVSLAKFSVSNLLQMLDNTEQQIKRLARMVNDLLNTSLITTGRLELELADGDLAQVVREVCLPFAERLKKENKSLIIIADKPIRATFDRLRVEQVVLNLLSNAIKYGNGKPIKVSVTNSNSQGTIIVHDQGIGISQDQLERIFKRFARAVSVSEYKGLGVGLYITDQIVKAHKGKINVDSKAGKGTTFTVKLPLKVNI